MISKNIDNTEKIPVKISMQTSQEGETLCYDYTGFFQIKNRKKYLVYNDGAEKCSLTVSDGLVRMSRFKSESVMTFEQNAEHISNYVTPMGVMPLAVRTESVSDSLCQNGTLSMEYNLSLGGSEPVKNKIIIKIEETKKCQ